MIKFVSASNHDGKRIRMIDKDDRTVVCPELRFGVCCDA